MAAVPIAMQVMVYPRDKSHDPFPATIAGFVARSDVGVGGGPIIPPGEELPPIKPPEEVWPPTDAHPEHPIVLPPDPPTQPPDPPTSTQPIKPNAWNWNDGTNPQYPTAGWFYVHVPAPGQPGPKRRA